MSTAFAFIFFILIGFIFYKYWLNQNSKSSTPEQLERMIKEKTSLYSQSPTHVPTHSPQSKSSELSSKIRDLKNWGEKVAPFLSQKFFSSEIIFEFTYDDLEKINLNKSEIEVRNDLFNLIFNRFLKGQKALSLRKVHEHTLKAACFLVLGEESFFFDHFDGSIHSVKSLKTQQDFFISDEDDFLKKLKISVPIIDKYFLLTDAQIQSESAQKNKKELAKKYHPDAMDLKLIPPKYQEQFFQIYSLQFSKLLSIQSKSKSS